MIEPWRSMADAPRDGTVLLAVYNDFSGVEICFWDEHGPYGIGWYAFGTDAGDYSDIAYVDDDPVTTFYYGWIIYPEQYEDHRHRIITLVEHE